jgi:hypothetical protein
MEKNHLKNIARRLLGEDAKDDKGNNFKLPTTHVPAVKVPKGGASCKNCKWLGPDGKSCTEQHFIEWRYGDSALLFPADEYCSDWWTPRDGAPDSGHVATPPPPLVGASPPSPSGKRVVHLKLPTK